MLLCEGLHLNFIMLFSVLSVISHKKVILEAQIVQKFSSTKKPGRIFFCLVLEQFYITDVLNFVVDYVFVFAY